MSSLEEADLAIRLGADALGLVGEMPSGPGTIDDRLAQQIALTTPPAVDTFVLTSQSRGSDIADHVARCGANTVQIVRMIDPAEYPALIDRLPTTRRVQVVHVQDASALDCVALYEPYVHAFLLDSGRPDAPIAEFGGTGRAHDWSISAEFVRRSSRPVFLAGGLNPDNVEQAIRQVAPFGVDLCSGVRTERQLDEARLRAFMRAVRRADAVTG